MTQTPDPTWLRLLVVYILQLVKTDPEVKAILTGTTGGTTTGGSTGGGSTVDLSNYVTFDELTEALAGVTVDVLGTPVPTDSAHSADTLHGLLDTLFGRVATLESAAGIVPNALTLGGETLTLGGETLTLGV